MKSYYLHHDSKILLFDEKMFRNVRSREAKVEIKWNDVDPINKVYLCPFCYFNEFNEEIVRSHLETFHKITAEVQNENRDVIKIEVVNCN